jgi:ubiquitin carboxyl-terminal hydrolase L5
MTAISDSAQTSETIAPLPKIVNNWQGWAELENDPAIFSTLLREWGVPSVQVQEVFDLDALFDEPSESVFGLVFLSRWTAAEPETEHQLTVAPTDLWFANQVPLFFR